MGSRPLPPPAWGPTLVQTRMATRLVEDREAYLGGSGERPIGRRIDEQQHELFVVCGAADALTLEFEHRAPDYIALHDLGAAQSLAVLQVVAQTAHRKVQRLSIRRQGYGDTLATLHFVELPRAKGGGTFRVYACSAEIADAAEATRVAATLLGHSRLGVLLAGRRRDAQAAMAALDAPLASPHWRNRSLLLLPMTAEAVSPDPLWPRPDGLAWHDAPPCTSAQLAWIEAARLWNQLQLGDTIAIPEATAAVLAGPPAMTSPAGVSKPVVAAHPQGAPAIANESWRARLDACAALPGFVSGCVFEQASQRSLAQAGGRPGPASLAAHGAALVTMAQSAGRKLGLSSEARSIVITLALHHLALVPLEGGLVLHAVFDAERLAAAVLQAALAGQARR